MRKKTRRGEYERGKDDRLAGRSLMEATRYDDPELHVWYMKGWHDEDYALRTGEDK